MAKHNEIRLALVGVGNCASTLVQGVSHYRRSRETAGLIHPMIADLAVADIHFACAFDVDRRKVGRRLNRAIFAAPNNSRLFCKNPDDDGATVHPSPVLDGLASHLEQFDPSRRAVVAPATRTASPASASDIARILQKSGATILVNYLPVGSQKATELYATACLEAGIAMLNCIPVFIASDPAWSRKFRRAGLPIIGDDVKSQFGATITHRVLMKLAERRGFKIDSSYQLNVGGNTDFLNMLERSRLSSKKISKTEAVTSQVPMEARNIHIGPSDYVPFLEDKKVCYVRMNMRGFGGLPMELDMKLQVEDSPNSAGVVVDAVRCLALARRAKIAGPLEAVSAALMKRPAKQMIDDQAADAMDAWIAKLAR